MASPLNSGHGRAIRSPHLHPSKPLDKHFRHRVNAGRVALRRQVGFFRKQFANIPSDWKEDETRVTFADFALSEKITAELRQSFPRDDYCSEEANPADEVQDLRATYAWVLDPIDGTNNYAIGLPNCAISLALLRHGCPVYGLVYDYARDRLMQGGPGQGVADGCDRRYVSDRGLSPHSILGLHFPLTGTQHAAVSPLLEQYRVRSLGSATMALAYTAAGYLDGCLDFRVKVWDIAAAYALLQGGGGTACFLGENPFPLKRFHAQAPKVPYYAGSSAFNTRMEALFAAHGEQPG